MADINTLTQNVIQREKEKLNVTVEDYRKQTAEAIVAEKAKLDQEFAQKQEKLEKNKAGQLDISLNSIHLKKRDDILSVKQELIGQFISDVKQGLEALDGPTTKDMIFGVVNALNQEEGLELTLGEHTRHKLEDSLWEFDQRGIQVSDQVEGDKSGFILSKGAHQYNYLYDNLIEDYRPQLQKMLLDQLFQS